MSKDTKNKSVKSCFIKKLEGLALQKTKEKYPSFPYPPKQKYTDKTANGLTRCVIDFISLNGYQAERINSMGRQLDKRTTSIDAIGRTRTIGSIEWIKGTSKNGTADISATIKGKSVKIEIKCKATGDNRQSQAQKEYQKEIESAGGIYLIVRDFDSFYNWYLKFLKDE